MSDTQDMQAPHTEHEKQDRAQQVTASVHSRRDTGRLGGHVQPTCTHARPRADKMLNRALKHHRGRGEAATEEHADRSRPRETNPQLSDEARPQEIRGGNGKWSLGYRVSVPV